MLLPHTPGTEWIASRHGVCIPTAADLERAGRDTWFSTWCERQGIPTGTLIPQRAYQLASRAYALQPRWAGCELDAQRAAAAERDAARDGMVREALAMCRPVAMAAE